jgi:hypothetical protein
MLADAATVADGKLYVHGGGWDQIHTAQAPTRHPAFALVLVFRLDWHEANEDIPLSIKLADEDQHNVLLQGQGVMRAGTPPQLPKGSPLYHSHAQMIYGIVFPALGRYTLKVSSAGKELASLPITVAGPT